MTDTLLIIVIISLGILTISIFFSRKKSNNDSESQAMQLLQNQLGQLTRDQNEKLDRAISELNTRLREQNKTLSDQLNFSQKNAQQQFTVAQKNLQELTEKLTKLDETNKQVVGFAEQLESLEKILRNPKQRGVLGEYYLETVIRSVLPENSYELQYKFKNGETVDALIKTKQGNIPVDAKFSLENYNRYATAETAAIRDEHAKKFKDDLKKRIDETGKYIKPEEGTLEFAFMFVPADGLYYDLLMQKIGDLGINQQGLIEYAFKKRVLIVSPTTFFAYLQTVLQGLRALKIEESVHEIQKNVEQLQRHLHSFTDYMNKLGKNLNTTVNQYNLASKEFTKIDKDIFRVAGGERLVLEVDSVEKIQDNPLDE